MNHFEGRLERRKPEPVTRYFGSEAQAENEALLHPTHVAHVMRGLEIVSTFCGDECK